MRSDRGLTRRKCSAASSFAAGMLDLLAQDVAVAGVPREVLDGEQVDEPQVDLAQDGVCPDIVEVESGSDGAGTLPRAFELGDHVGPGFAVVDEETGISCSRAAATLALRKTTEEALKPDPFS